MAPIKKPNITNPPATQQDFPIVGIGASAGGLDAFKRLLKAIPENSGMAYVLVQHLDPAHESLLPEILSRVTNLPVNEITDDIHLAPDHIYVIPENKILTSIDGILKIAPRKIKINHAIDIFFKSLAEVHQSLAAGVVLSGTASDCTLGLKAIKLNGGLTFAQDQQSATFGEMPQNAVDANVVDFVLPPEEIPDKLIEILRASSLNKTITQNENGNVKSVKGDVETIFKQIVSVLRQYSGVDFTSYKQTTFRRRVARRIALTKQSDLNYYLKFLRFDKIEQESLFNDVLIPVTSFFRDSKIFEALRTKVFPTLFRNKKGNNGIRIWVAGCSTGEEAYSIAIELFEHLGEQLSREQIQIFASDLSEISLKKARAGIYNKADLSGISEALLKKYFIKNNGDYQVNRQIKDICVFAKHNFLKDPPFAKIDLISCRNVLIYMETILQKKALTTFHYALNNSGFLLLGKSETTGLASDLFSALDGNEKIYLRKEVPVSFMQMASDKKEEKVIEKIKKTVVNPISPSDFRKNAESILLAKYTPASIIVNEQLDVVHIHGPVVPFLAPPQGKPSFNLFKMAIEGLTFELQSALLKVKASHKPLIKEGIAVNIGGRPHEVRIEIIPLSNTLEPYYLILFQKNLLRQIENNHPESSESEIIYKESIMRISQLEKELSQLQEDMYDITEDQEASKEKLQSANEELLSGSEALQSLNEELETSKEELQYSNEELIIINQELVDKHEQLNDNNLYTEAIIATVKNPLVVLDKTLRIKTINIAFTLKFNIAESEAVGKLIYEIQNHLFDNADLRSRFESMFITKSEIIDLETTINLQPFGKCTLVLNARHLINDKNKEQLILLAIEDITKRKSVELHLQALSVGLEAKIEERTSSLEQTNLQLEQFAHTVSHELQEPLRKINTFSKLLQKKNNDNNPQEVEKYLTKIEDASTRMTKLVHDLLNFTSISSSPKLFEKTDLNEILKNNLSDFELLMNEKKAKVTYDSLPEIEAIPYQMNQVFYDIISNALKFSKKGEAPVISISSNKLTKKELLKFPKLNQNSNYYEIIFKDNGIGFHQKYAHKIFIMFQKLGSFNEYAGTGIGMALSKKVIQNHHGEIFATGVEQKGAEFHIILPEKQPE